jgi:hypothetical protein
MLMVSKVASFGSFEARQSKPFRAADVHLSDDRFSIV